MEPKKWNSMAYPFSYLNKGLIANELLPPVKLNLDIEKIFVVIMPLL